MIINFEHMTQDIREIKICGGVLGMKLKIWNKIRVWYKGYKIRVSHLGELHVHSHTNHLIRVASHML